MRGGSHIKQTLAAVRENKTARILLLAGAALLLLLTCWLVFGNRQAQDASGYVPTDREARLSALLSEVDGAGEVTVLISEEGNTATGAVVLFDGEDGILVRLRLTQIVARALGIAENRVLVCPSDK